MKLTPSDVLALAGAVEKTAPKKPKSFEVTVRLPMQPLVNTESGVIRFKANRIVSDLYDFSVERGFGMNQIAVKAAQGCYTKEEQMQFAQLIGYSLGGYEELSYVSDESYEEAENFVSLNGLVED